MGGGAVAELTQTQSGEFFKDNYNNVNMKDKKKKRRSRRTKQNSTSPDNSSLTKIPVGETQFAGGESTSSNSRSNDRQLPRASDVEFSSPPNMHIDKQQSEWEEGNHRNQHTLVADTNERLFSSSCPDNFGNQELEDSNLEGDIGPPHPINVKAKRKLFAPHWLENAVTEALEKGDVFKALFCVNAHNKLEAYCKIDGLQTDVLINGLVAQNRAIEGDMVAVKVDPRSLWFKMKGYNGNVENSTSANDNNLHAEAADIVLDSLKGKNKIDVECSLSNGGTSLEPYKNGCCNGEIVNPELIGPSDEDYFSGPCSFRSDGLGACCSSSGDEAVNALANLCATVSSFPSKRPTGRVVRIIEMSPRRNTVVGFLGVKQLIRSKEGNRKDTKKNKLSLSALNPEYIMLTPTDPKFPKMMVSFRSLPECLKNRLEAGDATVEMDLLAARIVGWDEENNVPEAHVTHSFGRGGEIEAQIAAILFENAINASCFSPESLSCVPTVPWEVPLQELERRKDLRNLCIFTIDPSTATDLDDALSVDRLSNGTFRVGVHIADVSYFVLPETALDIDAQIRSTSVYMLQRKLSMLPPILSENLGSLNPGVDRLAFSMFWDINPDGEVLDRWIGRTVIHSCCKLSYEHAQDMISGLFDAYSTEPVLNDLPDLHGCFEWSQVVRSVKNLNEISMILKTRRFNDGALSLESPKVAFLFDEDGIPYDSVMCGRKESNFLVEEFMLLANRTAAEIITRAYPCSALLRRHSEPNKRKLREYEAFCNRNGIKLDVSSSAQFHCSLERIRGELKNDAVLFDILMTYATRPMQLAAYFCPGDSEDGGGDWGHYALAIPLYTHFTSPLRRYPDILVHRMLAATLEAEEMYLKHKEMMQKLTAEEVMDLRCFTGMSWSKEIVESSEAQDLLSAAASKYKVPCTEIVADIASHCNDRNLAARHVKDGIDKLYMWALVRKKEILCLEARVMGLGPRFMSIYIPKLAVERRIYYDEVDSLTVEWLDTTSTLVLSRYTSKHYSRRGSPGKFRRLEEVALIVSPCDSKSSLNTSGDKDNCDSLSEGSGVSQMGDVAPAFFPLTVRLLSTIPVALHAVGGDYGPVDIGARLYVSSYLK